MTTQIARAGERRPITLTEVSAKDSGHRVGTLLGQIVFVGLLIVMTVAVIPYGTVDAWWQAVFECGIWLLMAIWIVNISLWGGFGFRKLFVLLPLIFITLYAFAQTFAFPPSLVWLVPRATAQRTLTIDSYQTFITARKMLALTSFFGLLLLHTSSPSRLRWLVRVVIGLGLGSALFGILRQVLQSPDSTVGFVLPFLFPNTGYGQFISSNVFSYLMEMAFALVFGLMLGGGVRRDRVLVYLAILLPIWAALVLSNSRGGVIGLSLIVMIILFTSLKWHRESLADDEDNVEPRWWYFIFLPWARVLLVGLAAGILIIGVFWIGGQDLSAKLQSPSAQEMNQGMARQNIWRSTWRLVKSNPWTGVGFGCYFLAIPQYQARTETTRLEQAHEDYMDLAANGGVVAVLLACWFLVNVIRRVRPALGSRDAYRRAACLGAVGGLLSVCVHSLVDFGLQVTGIAVVFGALLVIAAGDQAVERSPQIRRY